VWVSGQVPAAGEQRVSKISRNIVVESRIRIVSRSGYDISGLEWVFSCSCRARRQKPWLSR
jgi:hypothetical protein